MCIYIILVSVQYILQCVCVYIYIYHVCMYYVYIKRAKLKQELSIILFQRF